MLKSLAVKNFAIIEDLSVSFEKGMTVLTGETGAGKSLIIDTISLLLGARADSDMIRYGEKSASIQGVFTHNSILDEILTGYSIPIKEDIIIERSITDTSKNTVKINSVAVTLAQLKAVSRYLADIHIQNDTYKLFNPDGYLEMLDGSCDEALTKYKNKYSKALLEYLDIHKVYEKILKGQKSALERLEFLKFEAEEIGALDLYPNIDVELNETITKLSNFDKISSSLSEAYNYLDQEQSSIDSLYDAAKALESIEEYDTEYSENASKLLDAYYIADEIKGSIRKSLDSLDYDEEELNMAMERMKDIEHVMDKYKKNVSELIEYLKEITLEIDMVENYDETLKENKKKLIASHETLVKSSIELTNYRKKMAKNLVKGIIQECKDLDLPNTEFDVAFQDIDYSNPEDKVIFREDGCDSITFLISFNKGEPLKPLYKVASGGEASRIMLAFKSYLSKTTPVSLMVFDEIDTGVSGVTAKKIADKMHFISKSLQVLCITHLPQVAAKGDSHMHIYKLEEKGRTRTEIKKLEGKERIEEVAIMLSGDTLSLYALEHARELIES